MATKTDLIQTAKNPAASPFARLRALMAQLRNPDGGCEWDLAQDFASIAPYTLEEAYEVASAIEQNNLEDLKEELGDLLLQVFFHAQIAEDAGHFSVEDVFGAILEKMIRRHPHVFDAKGPRSASEQQAAWETIKAEERDAKDTVERPSVLAGVAHALPALVRAEKLVKRAARVGFDYPTIASAAAKVEEELAETLNAPSQCRALEYGDLLFSVVCLGYKLDLDPEQSLKQGVRKFENRFYLMEQALGGDLRSKDLAAMDEAWNAAKLKE